MPVLKHAKKKLKQDRKRTEKNRSVKELFRDLIKKARKSPTAESVSLAFSQIDKAAKNHLIHKNKAARMKSSLAKVLAPTESATASAAEKPAKKTTAKKAPAKKTPAKKKK